MAEETILVAAVLSIIVALIFFGRRSTQIASVYRHYVNRTLQGIVNLMENSHVTPLRIVVSALQVSQK